MRGNNNTRRENCCCQVEKCSENGTVPLLAYLRAATLDWFSPGNADILACAWVGRGINSLNDRRIFREDLLTRHGPMPAPTSLDLVAARLAHYFLGAFISSRSTTPS